jgi:hypothetical protein
MPTWGNTDSANNKPKFGFLRQTRELQQFTVANTALLGNTVITVTYTDGTPGSNVANLGVTAGMSVYGTNVAVGGTASFFKSNNQVLRVSGNNIVLLNPVIGNVNTGIMLEIDSNITFNNPYTQNNFSDTILVTSTRMANTLGTANPQGSTVANTFLGSVNQGWNLITKKINSDGTIRFLKETLVCLANATASNTSSANTSANAIYGGL